MDENTEPRHPGPLVAGPNPREERTRRKLTWWRRILFALTAPVAVGFIRLLWATYRFEVRGDDEVRKLAAAGNPVVLAFWHEGLFVLNWLLARLSLEGMKTTYLISPSMDGELAVRMLAVIGGRAVRGSASRSGVKAMRGLYRAMRRDSASPVMALDGPIGPRRFCKPGAIMLARLSGAPLVPLVCASRRSWRLHTWDRMLVPVPFTRVVIDLGKPYIVPPAGDEEDLEKYRIQLENRLEGMTEEAESRAESTT